MSRARAQNAASAAEEIAVLTLADIDDSEERETLEALCIAYREESDRERSAKASKDTLLTMIVPLAEKLGIARGKTKLAGEGWQLVQRASSRSAIDPKRLLAKGVSADVIVYATVKKETPYYTVLAAAESDMET